MCPRSHTGACASANLPSSPIDLPNRLCPELGERGTQLPGLFDAWPGRIGHRRKPAAAVATNS